MVKVILATAVSRLELTLPLGPFIPMHIGKVPLDDGRVIAAVSVSVRFVPPTTFVVTIVSVREVPLPETLTDSIEGSTGGLTPIS